MSRVILLVGVAVALCSTVGCVGSLQPLSDAKTSTPDLRLIGEWAFEDGPGGEQLRVNIAQRADVPNVLSATADDGKQKQAGDLFLTKVGEVHFVSIALDGPKEGKKEFLFTKYEVLSDGSVKFWSLDHDFFVKAVEANKLKGTVIRKLFHTNVTLDDSPENLAAFFKENGDQCFDKESKAMVRRVEKPSK